MTVLTASCSLLVCSVLCQDVKIEVPSGPPLVFATAVTSQDGKTVAVARSMTVPVQEQKTGERAVTRTIVEDGVQRTVTENVPYTYTVTVMKTAVSQAVHQPTEVLFRDLDGKEVPAREALVRLKKRTGVILLPKKQKLAPFYKTVVKKDVLILTVPQPPRGAPAPRPRRGAEEAFDVPYPAKARGK